MLTVRSLVERHERRHDTVRAHLRDGNAFVDLPLGGDRRQRRAAAAAVKRLAPGTAVSLVVGEDSGDALLSYTATPLHVEPPTALFSAGGLLIALDDADHRLAEAQQDVHIALHVR